MRTHRTEIALLVIAAIALAFIAVGRERAGQHVPPSVYSTYDSGPNGYRALFAVLQDASVPVRRYERVLGLLDADVRTLVISGYEIELTAPEGTVRHPQPLDDKDAAFLKRFVQDGGRLVVLDTDFAGKDDITPGVGKSMSGEGRDAIALANNRFTNGVRRVVAPIENVFPFSDHRATPLLANKSGVVAVAYRFGKGEVVAITVPAIFGNAYLRRGDNLAFAYDAIAGHGPAAFDEYVHGYTEGLSFWDALPQPVHTAIWIVVALVALALAFANVPFAPPIPAEPPDERDSSAYLDAMASLMRRAHAQRAAIATFAGDARRRTRRSADPRASEAAQWLEDAQSRWHPSDDTLVRAARLDYQLRKDFT